MAKRRKGPTLIQQSRRTSPEEKALYHQTLGAGAGRVLRPFLGLTAEDERDIVATVEKAIDRRLSQL
jgi:phage gpG-like protein